MKFRIYSERNELLKMGSFWNSVLESSTPNVPFLTHEWMVSWWKCFGVQKRLFLIAAQEQYSERPIGIAPLMISRSIGFRVIEFIGSGASDYLDFIISRDANNVLKNFFSALNEYKDEWDIISLRNMLPEESRLENIKHAVHLCGWRMRIFPGSISPYIPIDKSFDDFLSSKSANFRYTLKKKMKRIQQSGKNFSSKLITSIPEKEVLNFLSDIEAESWKLEAGIAKMHNPETKAFYENFIKSFGSKGWLNLWIGFLDNDPTSYLINFDYNNKIWYYNSAYKKHYAKYSCGSLLTYKAVQDAFNRKKAEYDFLIGNEAYKRRWTEEKRHLLKIIIYKKTPQSLAGYLCFVYFRRLLNRIRRFLNIT